MPISAEPALPHATPQRLYQFIIPAFIDSKRRRPSLKLIARLADSLGIDRQELLVLAHPEAKALLAEPQFEPSRKTAPSWQRFIKDHALLPRYHVTSAARTFEPCCG
jgi:hypothetical protein